ncbi:di-trans,polycis-polyprenyl diphosphate synthase [Klebsormidium nitens]|uniref:Alkyl transferase n=1 Tax=Klebsormidium nitens TaxID=105231 RepID=A0A1Y1IHQ2_KLENI|nr:di-trans,polycis-polyprenyl diphosphate synthase [Klebsormidium nitens]|eukprot:GAQ89029.1 di-trans,polycis-polyprenyl diphosphate synthase [Klebsormidium nitens]
MDGNRRYADRSKIDRRSGHVSGYASLMKTLEACLNLGVEVITVYAFSIDNFKRSPEEVSALMDLVEEKLIALAKETELINKYGICVKLVGNTSLLPEAVQRAGKHAEAVTGHHSRSRLNLALAYTSRDEIRHAVECVRDDFVAGSRPSSEVNQDPHAQSSGRPFQAAIEEHLYTSGCPPVDLLVRTSGEARLSNFLLWQSSSACLAFCQALWPEFSFRHLVWAVLEYQRAKPWL